MASAYLDDPHLAVATVWQKHLFRDEEWRPACSFVIDMTQNPMIALKPIAVVLSVKLDFLCDIVVIDDHGNRTVLGLPWLFRSPEFRP